MTRVQPGHTAGDSVRVVGSLAAFRTQTEYEMAGYVAIVHNMTTNTEEYRTSAEDLALAAALA